MRTHVNIGRIVSASLDLARKAATIIQNVHSSGDLQTVNKGVNDPMTQADLGAQRLIISGLWAVYPGLVVIGEEDTPDLVASHEMPDTTLVEENSVPEELRNVPLEDVCVFVDPLDATLEFTQGHTHCVMTLVGVAVKGKPVAGVMHQSLGKLSVWAIKGAGVFGLPEKKKKEEQQHEHEQHEHDKGKLRGVTSASRATAATEEALEVLGIEARREGGCGWKVMLVAMDEVDVYLYARAGTKRWDTCAGEVVLNELGGDLTDVYGNHYDYSAKTDVLNSRGLIATRNKDAHKKIVTSIAPVVQRHKI